MKARAMRVAVLGLVLAAAGVAAWRLDLPERLLSSGDGGPAALYGNVDIREAQLGFRVGGRIAVALVDEGDRVEAGAPMARLDAAPYRDAMAAAEARVRARRAALDKLRNGPRASEIAQAQAEWEALLADLRKTRLDEERAARLRASDAVSQATLDDATAFRDVARARAAAAEAALALLKEGAREEDIAAAEAELQIAEADLAAARTALEDAELRAPAAGVVVSRVREPGAIVSPGDVVYALSLSDGVWVRAYVPEPELGRVHPGMAVEVVTDTAPDRPYRGRVGFVSPVAEFTPKSVETPELRTDLVYRLRVIVEAPDKGLRQGMPVTVRLPATG